MKSQHLPEGVFLTPKGPFLTQEESIARTSKFFWIFQLLEFCWRHIRSNMYKFIQLEE